jgi:hypothetical protein
MGQVKWSFSGVDKDGEPLEGLVEEITKEESQDYWRADIPWDEFFDAGDSEFYLTRNSGQLADLTTAIVFEMEFLLDNMDEGKEADTLRKEYKKLRAQLKREDRKRAKAAKAGGKPK